MMGLQDSVLSWLTLEQDFNIIRESRVKEYTFNGQEMLKEQTLQTVLEIFREQLAQHSSLSPLVVASMFSKQYGSMVTSGAFYAYYFFKQGLDVSLKNVTLETDRTWNPFLVVHQVYHSGEQEFSVTDLMEKLFAQHLTPLFQKLSKVTGVKERLLWANLAFSLKWYFEKWRNEAKDLEQKKAIEQDYRYVMEQAPPAVFGLRDGNPLAMEFAEVAHPRTGAPFRLRKMCCLRYNVPDCDHCTTCPNIDMEHRRALLEEYEKQ